MTPKTIPNRDQALRILAVVWDADTQTPRVIESPILAWTLEPGQPPYPISLLDDLAPLAWCVHEGDTGRSYMTGENTVCLTRADTLRELTDRAQALAGLDA